MYVLLTISALSCLTLMALAIRLLLDSKIWSAPSFLGLYCIVGMLVAFTEMMVRSSETLARAQFWAYFGVAWPMASAFLISFALRTSRRHAGFDWRVAPAYLASSAAAVGYAYLVYTGDVIAYTYGYTLMAPFTDGIIGPLILANYGVQLLAVALILVIPLPRRSRATTRRQRRWVLFAMAGGLFIGTGFSILRAGTDGQVPNFTGLAYVVFVATVYVGMVRRRFFATASHVVWQQSFAAIDDAVILTDEEYRIVEINEAATALIARDREQLLDWDIREFIPPATDDAEERLVWVGNEERYLSVSEGQQKNRTGQTLLRILVVRDVTREREQAHKLQRSFEHQSRLLKEVHHRVKNSLQIIDSIVGLKSRDVAEREGAQAISEIALRVRVISSIYNRAYEEPEVRMVSLQSCIRDLGRLHRSPTTGAVIVSPNEFARLYIEIDDAIPLLLAVADMVSICEQCRQADTRASERQTTISLGPAGHGSWRVTVSLPSTSGAHLIAGSAEVAIAQLLARQIDGALDVENDAKIALSITFPVASNRRMRAEYRHETDRRENSSNSRGEAGSSAL